VKLSIIIVSWNVAKDLSNCLKSIGEYPPSGEFEIIVVDNASTDGTVEAVEKNFPEVVIVNNRKNMGFAAANNQGIKLARGQHILLLNPDTIIHPNSIDQLISFMEDNSDVGACGPKLLNEDGTVQRSVRRFPSFRAAFYRHTIFKLLGIFKKQYRKWLMKDFSYDCQAEVCQLMGAALLTRKSVLEEVGGMDERFFMYYEEVDLCYRIKKAGWRIVFTPESEVTHLGGRSAEQVPAGKRIMMLMSMLAFFKKHKGRFATGVFGVIFKPLVLLIHFYYLFRDVVKYIFALLLFKRSRQVRCARRIRNTALFLGKHSWSFLFKI